MKLTAGLEVDSAPREVEVPADLATALAGSNAAQDFFTARSFSNQRGCVTWVEDAKKEEIRNARVAECVQSLEASHKAH